jgi:hypothetical protein
MVLVCLGVAYTTDSHAHAGAALRALLGGAEAIFKYAVQVVLSLFVSGIFLKKHGHGLRHESTDTCDIYGSGMDTVLALGTSRVVPSTLFECTIGRRSTCASLKPFIRRRTRHPFDCVVASPGSRHGAILVLGCSLGAPGP